MKKTAISIGIGMAMALILVAVLFSPVSADHYAVNVTTGNTTWGIDLWGQNRVGFLGY